MTVTKEILPASTRLDALLNRVRFDKPKMKHYELTMPDGDTIYAIVIKDSATNKKLAMSMMAGGDFEVYHWG